MCPRWLNGAALASYMLGSSGHNTENLTANHSGAPCWEKCHVPRTLKNAAVVGLIGCSIGVGASAPLQQAKLPNQPTPPFSSGNLNSLTLLSLCPHPIFHFIIISCSFYHPFHVHRPNIAGILLLGRKTSIINQSITVYTDGSKDGDRVASAALFGDRVSTLRLPPSSSIFTAEAKAIILALKFIAASNKSKFIICSDSLSCLLAIQSEKLKNPFNKPNITCY